MCLAAGSDHHQIHFFIQTQEWHRWPEQVTGTSEHQTHFSSWSCPPVPLWPHLGRSCTVSWEAGATSSYRAAHPVCGNTAITDCQTTAKHWKEHVWWQESSTGHARLPGSSMRIHHRYTNMVWCPAVWMALLKRVGIFLCFTLDLHLITLIIRAKFPSRWCIIPKDNMVVLYASLWNKSH